MIMESYYSVYAMKLQCRSSMKLLKKKRRPISRVLSWTIIHLGLMSPSASSNLPRNSTGRTCLQADVPLFGLAPGGVYHAASVARSAVRSYRTLSPLPNSEKSGGILSVALAVGFHPPGVTWHLTLWSPDFPHQLYTDGAIAWSSLACILPKPDYFC